MITVKEYRGHIRNWEELCERLEIPLTLTREEREERILVRAYETWGYEMADHMHGMFAFALWDENEKKTVLPERSVRDKAVLLLRDSRRRSSLRYYDPEDHGAAGIREGAQ